MRCRSSSTRLSCQEAEAPNRNLQKRREGSSRVGKPALPKNLIPRLPVQVRLTGEVPEACYRSSLCAQGTPAGDADEQLNAQKCCGEEESLVRTYPPPYRGAPLIAAPFAFCPLGPVGGMYLDRVVGRWELAAAARVSVGPSDKTRQGKARPGPGQAHGTSRGRAARRRRRRARVASRFSLSTCLCESPKTHYLS